MRVKAARVPKQHSTLKKKEPQAGKGRQENLTRGNSTTPEWIEIPTLVYPEDVEEVEDEEEDVHLPLVAHRPVGTPTRIEEPEDDIIEIDLSEARRRPRRRKTIGQALDRFIDDTMEAIDPLIQKYAPVVQEVSRVANDPAVQNLLAPSLEAMTRPRPGMGVLGSQQSQSLFDALFTPPTEEEVQMMMQMSQAFMGSTAMNVRGSFSMPSRSTLTTSMLPDGDQNGDRNPRVQQQKITTPFGEMHMMVISGSSTENLTDS